MRSDGTLSATPASAANVGMTSKVEKMALLVLPAGTCPGHRTIQGTRIPPSQVDPFAPRSGPELPHGIIGPFVHSTNLAFFSR